MPARLPALVILLVRRHVPESPRWLLIHGRDEEAERIVGGIEERVTADGGTELPPAEGEMTIHQRSGTTFTEIARTVFGRYRRRSTLGFALFIGQAFLYNAITFGFGAILTQFFDVPSGNTGYYFAVIAAGNFLGPLLLGKLFDTVGRRIMISGTYVLSGALLFGTAWLFDRGSLTAATMTACWCVVLFFASAGASSAYLTVSEIFPMETRAMSIAFFYALGTAAGGISGPLLFAELTGTGKVGDTVLAFQIGAGPDRRATRDTSRRSAGEPGAEARRDPTSRDPDVRRRSAPCGRRPVGRPWTSGTRPGAAGRRRLRRRGREGGPVHADYGSPSARTHPPLSPHRAGRRRPHRRRGLPDRPEQPTPHDRPGSRGPAARRRGAAHPRRNALGGGAIVCPA
ncbi:hypothetical protein SALBM217S_08269 [Streptomyces griseoloalbus]